MYNRWLSLTEICYFETVLNCLAFVIWRFIPILQPIQIVRWIEFAIVTIIVTDLFSCRNYVHIHLEKDLRITVNFKENGTQVPATFLSVVYETSGVCQCRGGRIFPGTHNQLELSSTQPQWSCSLNGILNFISYSSSMTHIPIGFSFPLEHENVTVGCCVVVIYHLPLIEFMNSTDQITRILSYDFSLEKRPSCSNTQTTLSCLINLSNKIINA